MKWLKNISVMVLGIVFLMSATGIVVYQSHCSCTGNQHVSLFVTPESCQDDYNIHQIHEEGREAVPSDAEECNDCTAHTRECGCSYLMVTYYKLNNEVVHEKARILTKEPVQTIAPQFMVILLSRLSDELPEVHHHCNTPPSVKTSLDFLIPIHQLKIPHLA